MTAEVCISRRRLSDGLVESFSVRLVQTEEIAVAVSENLRED